MCWALLLRPLRATRVTSHHRLIQFGVCAFHSLGRLAIEVVNWQTQCLIVFGATGYFHKCGVVFLVTLSLLALIPAVIDKIEWGQIRSHRRWCGSCDHYACGESSMCTLLVFYIISLCSRPSTLALGNAHLTFRKSAETTKMLERQAFKFFMKLITWWRASHANSKSTISTSILL